MKKCIALATFVAMALISVAAQGTTLFNQGLQADTSSGFDAIQLRGNYGVMTWVSTGSISLTWDNGSYYGVANNGNNYSRDVSQGFDFGVAAPGTKGAQPHGLIIHSALTSTGLLIGSVVDLNRHASDDPGGNHYGWFTLVNVPPGLALDKTPKNIVPGSLLLLGSGLVGLALYRRRRAGSEN
jgi:hypothetical protein